LYRINNRRAQIYFLLATITASWMAVTESKSERTGSGVWDTTTHGSRLRMPDAYIARGVPRRSTSPRMPRPGREHYFAHVGVCDRGRYDINP